MGVGYDEAAVDLRWTEDFAVPMGVVLMMMMVTLLAGWLAGWEGLACLV